MYDHQAGMFILSYDDYLDLPGALIDCYRIYNKYRDKIRKEKTNKESNKKWQQRK